MVSKPAPSVLFLPKPRFKAVEEEGIPLWHRGICGASARGRKGLSQTCAVAVRLAPGRNTALQKSNRWEMAGLNLSFY